MDENIGDKISDLVIQNNKTFPFKNHARDYFIGATSEFNDTILITYNVKHFKWLRKTALTPEEFVESFLDGNSS